MTALVVYGVAIAGMWLLVTWGPGWFKDDDDWLDR